MRKFLSVFKDAALRLNKHNPIRLSASTAFFSIFAFPPILIILSYALRTISNKDFTPELFTQLEGIVGSETTRTFKSIPENLITADSGRFYTIVSVILFVFVATNLLRMIQQSINELYSLTEKKRAIVTGFLERVIGFAFILFTGLLFLATMLLDTLLVFIGDYLHHRTSSGVAIMQTGNLLISFLLSFIWFAVILKFLPALRIHWKAISAASLVTSILFMLGKYILNWTILNGRIRTVYEASASAVLLLIFIFFVSLIIYYGACFAISFALAYKLKMNPKRFAVYQEKSNPTEADLKA